MSRAFPVFLVFFFTGVGAVPLHAALRCVGDCGADGVVVIDELLLGIEIALGQRSVEACPAFNVDGDPGVAVGELVLATRALLGGCVAASPTPTPSATPSATPSVTREPASRRPSFIVIELDDTRADGLDRMPIVQGRLAGEGVTFRNAFVPDPVCCPSRASLLSGRYAFHHGTRGVSGPIGGADTFRVSRADRRTIAVWLHNAGYQTALFGKYLNDYGPTEANRGPGGTFYVPPGWDRWRAMTTPEHYGGIHGPTYTLVDETGHLTDYDDHVTDAQYSTDLLAQELRAFITDSVNAGAPFFAVWAPYASHGDTPDLQPHPADRHFETLPDLPLWRPPSWNEADISDKPLWVNSLRVTPILAAVTDRARQYAYETLLAVDEQVGLTLGRLADLGVDESTVILLTSDNGVTWGEHRYFGQGKGCGYEEAIRVPLMVRYPRLVSRAATVDAAVLNIDVAPTVAALAGVLLPTPVDGVSFAPLLTGAPPPTWRGRFLLERWRELRADLIGYGGQVSDGDRLRLQYGPWRPGPRPSLAFEFDAGDGVTDTGAINVPFGPDADTSFLNLGDAVVARVPDTLRSLSNGRLIIDDRSSSASGVHWLVEVDQGGVIRREYPVPDWFGVRDVTDGYTYVEYETGEKELYDLVADPFQLENKANEPAYATVQADLEQALRELLEE